MHDNTLQTLGIRIEDSLPTRNDVDQRSFHFEIDGQDFVAFDRADWRRAHDDAITDDGDDKNILGEIVTSVGGYVIIADAPSPETEPAITQLLSRRELQVAHLIADGRCDKEIARQLAISIYTVREHIRRIFAKLHVCRRGGIIVRLLKQRR
jgi:ATP/maltotriose-dependent transcriptional regulator MalT